MPQGATPHHPQANTVVCAPCQWNKPSNRSPAPGRDPAGGAALHGAQTGRSTGAEGQAAQAQPERFENERSNSRQEQNTRQNRNAHFVFLYAADMAAADLD